jgi:hypothetical protein
MLSCLRQLPIEVALVDTASAHLTSSLLANLLREAFAGPPGPWTYFTDNRPGVGFLSTIQGLTAAEASLALEPGGATIAGHVDHVRASLAGSTELITRKRSSRDRTGTWTVTQVTDKEWQGLHAALRAQYEISLQTIQSRMDWDEDALGAAAGAVAHAAYHLGAVRQRLLLRGPA